ncbi:MAG: cell wall metabolism sensor histidine kinase WalK [Clostridiales Family XIII bacterium]|jgi:two-component system sensor histidine kinase VicK|nr:cell wall metabolism sensor histidine kinase WalK [Clostridiales Family XIII bacterium]
MAGKRKKMWSSIRWKLVFIYLLLVFIATSIIGVFIMNQLEAYYNASTTSNLRKTVSETTLLASLGAYDVPAEHRDEIQTSVDAWSRTLQNEIFVIDSHWLIVAATNEYKGLSAYGLLDEGLIFRALKGEFDEFGEMDATYLRDNENIPVKNLVFPIVGRDGEINGVLYFRVDMTSVRETLNESQFMFVRAMIIALAITVVLGFFIARSITVPINDVTEKAEKMAQGDFSQEVSVKSDDEIGRFAEMFNLLRIELGRTVSEISNEKNKLEAILKNMVDGLIAVDLSGQIIHANPAAREMLKFNEEDIKTKHYDEIIEIIGEYDIDLSLKMIRKNCENGAVMELLAHGGATYAVRYDRFQDEGGRDIGIIMLLQDITEQQKLEKMQMDFVANVSHELKTPLTTIKSYTETLLLGEVESGETVTEFLKIVEAEADRMNRLVKDLLQLSRLDYKQEKWHKKEGELIMLLKLAVKKVEMMAKSKEQRLNILFDPDIRMVIEMDRDRIEQVILNILSNAIKYTGENGRIDIDAYVNEQNAQVIISDNGIGIPENELSRVFERFFRVDKARSRSAGGTGLGLSISKQIIEEHKGSIEIESKERKGTRVTVTLPLIPVRGQKNIV